MGKFGDMKLRRIKNEFIEAKGKILFAYERGEEFEDVYAMATSETQAQKLITEFIQTHENRSEIKCIQNVKKAD